MVLLCQTAEIKDHFDDRSCGERHSVQVRAHVCLCVCLFVIVCVHACGYTFLYVHVCVPLLPPQCRETYKLKA